MCFDDELTVSPSSLDNGCPQGESLCPCPPSNPACTQTCGVLVTAESIDNSYCFLQVVNRLATVIYYFSNTTSSYLNVKVVMQSIACMYHFFDNFCPFGSTGATANSNAFNIWNALTANIPTLPASLGCSNIAGLGLALTNPNFTPAQINAVIDYIRFTKGSDFGLIKDPLSFRSLVNVPQNGFLNMCYGDYISPILNALIAYNNLAQVPLVTATEYDNAVSAIATAIDLFVTFQSSNLTYNTMDGMTGALYLFLTTPIGKVGMEGSFSIYDAVKNGATDQLNLVLVELGENNPPSCDYLTDTANFVQCGAFFQMVALCAEYEFSYPSRTCVINPLELACGCDRSVYPTSCASCSLDNTCNTGCTAESCLTIGTCDNSCIPDISSSCQAPADCATCPHSPGSWYDQVYGWQTSSASCAFVCPSNTTSTKKGEK